MQMNKLLKVFMMALCMVALSAAYVGCTPSEQQITKLIVDDASVLTVEQGTTLEDFEIVIKGMYPDSTEIAISKSDLTITGWDTATAGEKKLTITYTIPGTQTVLTLEDITLTVVKKIASVSYKEGSTETKVEKGGTLDYSGLKLLVTYEGESTPVEVAYNARTMQIALDTSTAGTKTMTITYMGKTATTQITVIELSSIAFDPSSMSQTAYQYVPLSTAGASITATYSDNSTKTINTNLTFSGVNTQNAGVQNLVIGYKGLSTPNIAITVKEVTAIAYASGLADAINQGAILAKSGLKLTATYDGATKTLDYNMIENVVEFSGYDTSVAGDQTITITLGSLVTTHDITVITNNGMVLGFQTPALLAERQIDQNTYTDYFNPNDADHVKGFAETNHMYVVGNQNPWVFMPNTRVYKDSVSITPTTLHTTVKVYLGAEKTDEALIAEDDLADYVTIDNLNYQTYQFTQEAADKVFTIEVQPYENTNSRFIITFTFKVINGYNIYDAKDLSILDNWDGKPSYNDNNTTGKWTEWRNANDVEFYNNITPDDVTAIVFQNNIDLRPSDVPSVQFWDKDSKGGDMTLEHAQELNSDTLSDGKTLNTANDIDISSYQYFKGSVKDRMGGLYDFDHGDKYSEFVYTRYITSGTFTIEGNYYRLSIENYPRVQCITADGSVFQGGEGNQGTPITTHATLFAFQGKDDPTQAMNCHFIMRDLNLMGNAGRTENVQDSGGILGIKKKNAEMTMENVLSQKWFINIMNDEGHRQNASLYNSEAWSYSNSLTFKKVNMYDSYNTLVYNWAGALNIEDCNLIGAGGPVMICDHVGNNETTAAGGAISKVNVKNSVLQSWVAGTEGWFVSYGATALANMIKATDQAYLTISDNTKTILKNKNGITLMNLVAVYKSADVEGISSSQIRGTFDVYGYSNGLDLDGNIKSRVEATMQYVQLQKVAEKIAAIVININTNNQITTDTIVESVMAEVSALQKAGKTDMATILGNAVGTALSPVLAANIAAKVEPKMDAGLDYDEAMASASQETTTALLALIPDAVWDNILASQYAQAAQAIATLNGRSTPNAEDAAAGKALVKNQVFASIQIAIMMQTFQGDMIEELADCGTPAEVANVVKTTIDTIVAQTPNSIWQDLLASQLPQAKAYYLANVNPSAGDEEANAGALTIAKSQATKALYIEILTTVCADAIDDAAQQIATANERTKPNDADVEAATKNVVAQMLTIMYGETINAVDVDLSNKIVNTGLTALIGGVCTAGQAGISQADIKAITEQLTGTQVMQTYNDGLCVPGQDKTTFIYPTESDLDAVKTLFKAATGYTNLYLFNGMAAIFGLNDVSA